MGLDSFRTNNPNSYERYPDHPYDDKLEEWIDEFSDRFPINLNIEFIEVSPNRTKSHAAATYKSDGTVFIRVSEQFINNNSDERIKLTLIHEMTHVYFFRMGYKDTNHNKYFRWVVGRVMGGMTRTSVKEDQWRDCIEPFLEEHNQF